MRASERPPRVGSGLDCTKPVEDQRPDGELDFEAQGPCVPPWKIACGSEPANGLRIGIWEWQDGLRWHELPDFTWPLLERARRAGELVTIDEMDTHPICTVIWSIATTGFPHLADGGQQNHLGRLWIHPRYGCIAACNYGGWLTTFSQ